MKPAWDSLIAEYKDHASVLVADVDCTAGGKALCDEVGVRGYPTIKYGDPDDLQTYNGNRDLADLKKHAATLGPACGPANLDLCDTDKKKKIEEFTKMSSTDRASKIMDFQSKQGNLTDEFNAFAKILYEQEAALSKQYKEVTAKKDKGFEEIKNSGFELLKAVHKHESENNGKDAEL